MTPRLVLASESPYRRVLLDRLSVPYEAASHRCDERAMTMSATLEEHAVALASAKAASLAEQYPDSFIIGSDQIAEHDGHVLHKPGTRERAMQQLARLAGGSHRLLTAIALQAPGGATTSAIDVHTMHMRNLSSDEIERYVDADRPLDCCGSYKIESLGIGLFERIEGVDFTAITGMPMMALTRMLREQSFQVP